MIGVFVIGTTGLAEYCAATKPSVLLHLDPGGKVPLGSKLTIGRQYYDLGQQAQLLYDDPITSARWLAEDAISKAAQTDIPMWMGLNEPPVWDEANVARLCAIERARTEMLNAAGLKSCVLSLSVGWPRENMVTRTLVTDGFKPLLDWLPAGNVVGLHQYWDHTGPLAAANYDPQYPSKVNRQAHWHFDKPIIITECGIDHQGNTGDGWKNSRPAGMNLETWAVVYSKQIVEFTELVCTDDRVEGVVVFQFGGSGWDSFDVADHWQLMPCWSYEPPVVVPTSPTIRVLDSGVIHTLSVEEYLRGVVPAEMPALWEMDALKAQAVWARSYALWRIANPRHASFDVYATTSDQVWNTEMIHTRSDQAVRETGGMALTLDGGPFAARYVSKCGRADCPYCAGANGYNDTVWAGRACQYGARAMARRGDTWQQIATAFYGEGVMLTDIDAPVVEEPDGGEGDSPGGTELMTVKIYDVLGNEKDAAWLASEWGVEVDTSLRRAASDNFELIELREIENGNAIYTARVQDRTGAPWSGRFVGRYYPSAPNGWTGGSKPDNVPAPPEATSHVVFGTTNSAGVCEFGLGGDDYAGPGGGVSALWLAEHYAGTDCLKKMGMKPNTNHRTISPLFRYVPAATVTPDPTPTPTPDPVPDPTPVPAVGGLLSVLISLLGNSTLLTTSSGQITIIIVIAIIILAYLKVIPADAVVPALVGTSGVYTVASKAENIGVAQAKK